MIRLLLALVFLAGCSDLPEPPKTEQPTVPREESAMDRAARLWVRGVEECHERVRHLRDVNEDVYGEMLQKCIDAKPTIEQLRLVGGQP